MFTDQDKMFLDWTVYPGLDLHKVLKAGDTNDTVACIVQYINHICTF